MGQVIRLLVPSGVSEELACVTFNAVCKVLVGEMYDDYVKLPDDWEAELRGFLENYEFPCVGGMGWLSRLHRKQIEKLFQPQRKV